MKYTVYVEGQSEMLFVADVLQKYSNFDSAACGFYCINLIADDFKRVNFPIQGNINSKNFYQIINVNNDVLVNSRLRKDSPGLIKKGFDVVIGLRDVYGDEYKLLTSNARIVDPQKIESLHTLQTAAIGHEDIDCRLHFAIMEFEAWMLALIENYIKANNLNPSEVFRAHKIDSDINVEEIYHPFPFVKKIFEHCGGSYQKHESDTYTFLSTLSVEDYENLRRSGRCPSFTTFLDSLLGS